MARTALITGATSGIGLELSYLFAKDGYDLVLVARHKEALQTLRQQILTRCSVNVEVMEQDLSIKNSGSALYEALREKNIHVHTLVNNAGFGAAGTFHALDLQEQLGMIQLNITSLTELTWRLLPPMIQAQEGAVLNVASTAGFQPGPFMAVYYASKAYVLSFTEAVTAELAPTPIKVCCLCPGATKTHFQERSGLSESLLFRMGTMKQADVAAYGYAALKEGTTVAVPGFKNKAGAFMVRLTPRMVIRKLIPLLHSGRRTS